MTKAEANRLWVYEKIKERGWTEEIEAQALTIIEFRKQLEDL